MKCLVCQASWPDGTTLCPQCDYEHAAASARDPGRIQAARLAFRERTTAFAPATRVSSLDRAKPWLATALGFVIFVVWLRACGSGGRFW